MAARVGAYLSLENYETRQVVYDTDGTPMVVWRTLGVCSPLVPGVHKNGVWFGAQYGFEPSTYFFAPWGALGTGAVPSPMTADSQFWASSDDLYAVQEGDGKTIGRGHGLVVAALDVDATSQASIV